MTRYNFEELTDLDFESVVCDLLQKELEVPLEIFTPGPDGGIDLRYLAFKRKGALIIQCKRYKDTGSLLNHLSKVEKSKIAELKPKRYILATSASLTPGNKKTILTVLSPWVKAPSDIIGRDDLNNLLRKHKDVERSHIKLWLTSSEVLDSIVNGAVINRTAAILDNAKRRVRLWVPNPSYTEALKLLKNSSICVIAGPPGVGKSFLAEVLLLRLNADGYEAVVVGEQMAEAFQLWKKNDQQVFLFDDFLGRVHLESSPLRRNEDADIVTFFGAVAKSSNKIMILTTREYILTAARQGSERLGRTDFPSITYVLDIGKYTTSIRAEILYNHLFFSDLPSIAIQEVVQNKNYWRLINHPNYNPRLIDFVVNAKEDWTQKSFLKYFGHSLDHPNELWQTIFEQLPDETRTMLETLLTLPRITAVSDLHRAVRSAANVTTLDDVSFERSLRNLEDTFVKITESRSRPGDSVASDLNVEFANPSIVDFLWGWLNERPGVVRRLFDRSIYFTQRMAILGSPMAKNMGDSQFLNALELEQVAAVRALVDLVGSPSIWGPSALLREASALRREDSIYTSSSPDFRLFLILGLFVGAHINDDTRDLLRHELNERSNQWFIGDAQKSDVLKLLDILNRVNLDLGDGRSRLTKASISLFISSDPDFNDVRFISDLYPLIDDDISEEEIRKLIDTAQSALEGFEYELDEADSPDDVEEMSDVVESIGSMFEIEVGTLLELASARFQYLEEHESGSEPWWDYDDHPRLGASDNVAHKVDVMFESLLHRSDG